MYAVLKSCASSISSQVNSQAHSIVKVMEFCRVEFRCYPTVSLLCMPIGDLGVLVPKNFHGYVSKAAMNDVA